MTSQPPAMTPAVCLHDPYDIRGHWVNLADLDPDEHTEMIVYYEYFPHDYINLPTVVAAFEAWQDIYEQVSPTLWPAFLAYTNDSNCDEDTDDLPIPSRFLEAHMGEYESFDDYLYNNLAGDLIEEVNSCPEVVQRYFSWQSYIADATYDYRVLPAPGSGYFVFRNL